LSTKKKIIFVISEYSFFLSHRKKLIEYLCENYEITIITDLSRFSNSTHNFNELYKLEHLPKNKNLLNPFKFFMALKRIRYLINLYDPRYIFYVSLENCVIGSILYRFIKVKKSFFLVTGIGTFLEITSIKKFFVKLIFSSILSLGIHKNKTAFVFQNNNDYKDIKRSLFGRIQNNSIIPGSGIDLSNFYFKQREITNQHSKIKILFASRLLKEKGVMEYFLAAKELKNEYKEIEFYMAGPYDPDNSLSIRKKDFEKIKSSNFINYLGDVNNKEMSDLYLDYDIFALPSYREGLPAAALEAAASGMPLILTDVPGCRECLNNNKNGLLIAPKSVLSLKNAIISIHKNRDLISNQSLESRLFIERNFSINKIGASYIKLMT